MGAFAKMSRLSIKALRLYDQLSTLQPRYIDPQSGYRYYEAEQLQQLVTCFYFSTFTTFRPATPLTPPPPWTPLPQRYK